MKVPREERLILIEKMKSGEMTVKQVMKEYGMSKSAVYAWLERPIPSEKPKTYTPSPNKKKVVELVKKEDEIDISVYQNMTKDELIDELILAKANELRAKKGYEVRGVGANKEFIFLNNKNSK